MFHKRHGFVLPSQETSHVIRMSLLDQAQSFFRSVVGGTYTLVSVISTVDGQSYRVRDLPDKQQAANVMAQLRLRIMKLCDALEKKYPDKPQVGGWDDHT